MNKYRKAKCPFHDDSRPSLQFPLKQLATCFSGNCDVGSMDVVNLTEKKLNLSTPEAMKWLIAEFNPSENGNGSTNKLKADAPNYAQLFRGFEGNLKKSPKAKSYL